MSTEPTPEPTDRDDGTTPPAAAIAPDRPVVDGTAKTADEIRAELEELLAEDERRAAREPAGPAAVDGTDRVPSRPVTAPPHQAYAEPVDVDRGRTGPAVQAAAVTVRDTAQKRPDLLAAAIVAIVAILLIARRLRRDRPRMASGCHPAAGEDPPIIAGGRGHDGAGVPDTRPRPSDGGGG